MTVETSSDKVSEGYSRPASIEERSNRFFVHPISQIFAGLAIKLKISANIVSVLGLLSGWLAAGLYFSQPDKLMIIGGFIAMIFWHILDGADGRVARATGTTSAFGRLIDGVCDHLVFAAVYISITISMIMQGGHWSLWIIVLSAGASHATQAAGYEERRQKYQRRMHGIARDKANAKNLEVNNKKSLFAIGYDFLQRLVGGDPHSPLDDALEQNRVHYGDIPVDMINLTAPNVRAWSLLNANNRTIAIFLACMIGKPLFYFVWELVILNLALLALIFYEKRTETAIANQVRQNQQTQ